MEGPAVPLSLAVEGLGQDSVNVLRAKLLCAEAGAAAITGHLDALPWRLQQSLDRVNEWMSCTQAGARADAKIMEAAAETWDTCGEQLDVYALMLDAAAAGVAGDWSGARGHSDRILRALPSLPPCPPCLITAGCCDMSSLSAPLLRLLTGVAPREGDGWIGPDTFAYGASKPAAAQNTVRVRIEDETGACGDVLEEKDVVVAMQGGAVRRVVVSRAGVVKVCFSVTDCWTEPLSISLSVPTLHLTLPSLLIQAPLHESALLPEASVEKRVAGHFLQTLCTQWLPGRSSTLLYRGSRDGFSPNDFHRVCDGKDPTLTLIRAKGYTFGGYSGVSWGSPHHRNTEGHWVNSGTRDRPFIFSVVGPFGTVTLFPLMRGQEHRALRYDMYSGPVWSGGLEVDSTLPSKPFSSTRFSECNIGERYEDTGGWGWYSLTGTQRWAPTDMEVFSVSPLHSAVAAPSHTK